VIVIVTVASVLTTIWTAGQHGAASLGTTANVSKTLSVAALTSMVMMVLGILSVGGEHRHRTIVGSYLAEPRRGRVLIAKLASTGALGAVVGALTFGLALAIALPAFASRGVHQLGVDVPQLWLGAALASACFALLGVALGAVTRNTVGAIVAALVWAQLIEVTILQNLIPSLAKWLPTYRRRGRADHGWRQRQTAEPLRGRGSASRVDRGALAGGGSDLNAPRSQVTRSRRSGAGTHSRVPAPCRPMASIGAVRASSPVG